MIVRLPLLKFANYLDLVFFYTRIHYTEGAVCTILVNLLIILQQVVLTLLYHINFSSESSLECSPEKLSLRRFWKTSKIKRYNRNNLLQVRKKISTNLPNSKSLRTYHDHHYHCVKKCPNKEFLSGSYFPVFRPNTGKYGPEKTPYLDNFHTVYCVQIGICVPFYNGHYLY